MYCYCFVFLPTSCTLALKNCPDASDQCLDGWEFFEGSCYGMGITGESFSRARSHCKEKDAHLVEITSDGEKTFVQDFLKKNAGSSTAAWIGAKRYIFGNWEWDFSLDYVDTSGWPGATQSSQGAACAILSKDKDWGWAEQSCSAKSPTVTSVCEKCPIQRKCGNQKCYEILCLTAGSLVDAQDNCDDKNGRVLELKSAAESNFVKDFLSSADVPESSDDETKNVWLGASDKKKTGDFRWESGDRDQLTYMNWAAGQPNSARKHCVVLDADDSHRWTSVYCSMENSVVCEVPEPSPISG